MPEITGLNGAPLKAEKIRSITLNYDMRTTALKIENTQMEGNMDLTINILEQALRFFKNQQLVGQIIHTGQTLEQNQRILNSIKTQ